MSDTTLNIGKPTTPLGKVTSFAAAPITDERMDAATRLVRKIRKVFPDAVTSVDIRPFVISVRVGDVEPAVDGLLPLADVARLLGFREYRVQWIGRAHCYTYAGTWEGLKAEVYAYSVPTGGVIPAKPADPLAGEVKAA